MSRAILAILLFSSQLYLVLSGVLVFGVYINPLLLFIISLLIPVLYYKTQLPAIAPYTDRRGVLLTGFAAGAASICICIPALRSIFREIQNPGGFSDVIPQIEALYNRTLQGQQPYYPLEEFAWHPFPVYMPLHWLPLGITDLLNVDSRWVGVLCLAIACGLWGTYTWKNSTNILTRILTTALPSIVLWCFTWKNKMDIAVSFDLIIAGYYLLLATGLIKNSFMLTMAGIILCLLSRYTMVFWLPLFFILLWMHAPRQKSYIALTSIVAAFLVFYILPFFLREPSILMNGIGYHNHCAVSEWDFYSKEASHTFEEGLFFGPYFYDLFSGTMEQRVFNMRAVQGAIMFGLVIAGLILYRKWKGRMTIYEMSLPMLYLCLLLFFMFSPLVYRYYYLPLLVISAVLCSKVIMAAGKK